MRLNHQDIVFKTAFGGRRQGLGGRVLLLPTARMGRRQDPLADADICDDGLDLPSASRQIKEAPELDLDMDLQQEVPLFEHYGLAPESKSDNSPSTQLRRAAMMR